MSVTLAAFGITRACLSSSSKSILLMSTIMLFQASDAADMEVEDSGEQHVTLQLNPASSDGPVSVGLAVVTADKVGHTGPQP